MFSLILEGVKTVFGWAKDKAKAKHDRNMAQINNEARLLQSRETNNAKWEMAQLNDKDKFIRICAFLLFASPVLAYWISPELGARVQEGWNQLTPMQADVLRGICLAVFGIKKFSEGLGSTVAALRQGWSSAKGPIK